MSSAAAPWGHAPDAQDMKIGEVHPSLLVNPPPPWSGEADAGNDFEMDEPQETEAEKSAILDAISKRIKALGKKVQRVKQYKDKKELNYDQKAAIAGLPLIEASVKELESVKKTTQVLELSAQRSRNQERAELQKLADQRVAEAAQQARNSLLPRVMSLVSFLALHKLLLDSTPTHLSISEAERYAIVSVGNVLLANPPVRHVKQVIKGFLSGVGSWEDVKYSRLIDITTQFVAPRPPTHIPDPSIRLDPTITDHEPEAEPEAKEEEPEPEASKPVALGFVPRSTGGRFYLMQASELGVPLTMSESQAWMSAPPTGEVVQSEDVAEEAAEEVGAVQDDAGESWGDVARADATGGAPLDWAATGDESDELPDLEGLEGTFGGWGSATSIAASGVPLDWAEAGDEGHELPDLGGLQATFDDSNSATPIAQPVPTGAQPSAGGVLAQPTKNVTINYDGLTAISSCRGHAQQGSFNRGRRFRGEGGFRGRGGFRGEGGEGRYRGRGRGRGGYRGDGEGRGGYRADGEGRSGYRGGYRSEGGEGGYRGRGRAGYTGGGEGRGRGEYRGRGEGRGGSGFRGRSSSGNPTPTAETAAPA